MRIRHLLQTSLAALLFASVAHTAPPPGLMTFTARLSNGTGPLTGSHNFTFAIYAASTGGSALWTETQNGIMVDEGLVALPLGGSTPLTTTLFDGNARFLEVSVDGTLLDERVPLYSVPYALRAAVAETADGISSSVQTSLDAKYLPKGSALSCNANQAVTSIAGNTGNLTCSAVQSPLPGNCNAGDFLMGFTAAGVPTCSKDSTAIAAVGGGLTSQAQGVDVELSLADKGVFSKHIMDGTIIGDDIAMNTISSQNMAAGSVSGTAIIDGTITGIDLAANSIGASHLLTDSVSSAEIVDASITSNELAPGACTTTQILDGTIAAADMGANSVVGANVVDNSLTYNDVNMVAINGTNNANVTIVAGNNDIFTPVAFAAPIGGTCMITATTRLTGAAATGSALLRVLVRIDGGTPVTDNLGAVFAGAYGPSGQTFITRAWSAAVTAGTIEFGCRIIGTGDYIGDTADCTITAICL